MQAGEEGDGAVGTEAAQPTSPAANEQHFRHTHLVGKVQLSSSVASDEIGETANPRMLSFVTPPSDWHGMLASMEHMHACERGEAKIVHCAIDLSVATEAMKSCIFRGYIRTPEVFCPEVGTFRLRLRVTKRVAEEPPFDIITAITGMEITFPAGAL